MALSTISGTTGITDATITSAKLADFSAAVDLNGVELLLDADQDTSITADTDDRIDFKIAGVEHISISNSSGDTIIKPMVDAKDIVFQQYDGNKILEKHKSTAGRFILSSILPKHPNIAGSSAYFLSP